MANKKRLKKEIKQLRKRVEKAMERNLKAQKELGRLQKRIARGDTPESAASGLTEARSEGALDETPGSEALVESEEAGLASAQRATWKKHAYLRDRYEAHLAEGQDKTDARKRANADLVDKYGEESGFTEQDLQDILT